MLSVAFLSQALPMPYVVDGVKWFSNIITAYADDINPRGSWAGNPTVDLADFAAYSQAYAAHPDAFQNDEITLTFTNATDTIPAGFVSLGTPSCPFNGKLIINIAPNDAQNKQLKVTTPIFNTINDTVPIVYNDGATPIELELIRTNNKDDSTVSSLLADNVADGTGTSAEWKVKSSAYTSGSEQYAYPYSGVLGTIADNAEVNLYFNNNSVGSWMTSSYSVGLVCGSMGEYSKLHTYLSGANTGYTVKSTNGNAGGLVGEMDDGAELDIKLQTIGAGWYNLTASKTIISTGNSENTDYYAGGLVGYNHGGKVTIQKQSGSSYVADSYTCADNITAKTGAGGLFGYYQNSKTKTGTGNSPTINVDAVTFDLSAMTSGTGCKVNADNVGGLFGVLDSTGNVTVQNGSVTVENAGVSNNFGGIAGAFRTNALENNTFLVGGNGGAVTAITKNSIVNETVSPTLCNGGAIGIIDGSSAAYLNVDGFTVEFTNGYDTSSNYGGVVGDAGDHGSMLDIGTVTVKNYVSGTGESAVYGGVYKNGGGIVGRLNTGVLRLSGTTDLQGTTAFTSDARTDIPVTKRTGQLVGERGDSLVYAVGNGNTVPAAGATGWGFKRSTTAVAADDLGTWGEVVRIAGVETQTAPTNSTTEALYFNTSKHEVHVQSAVTDMSTSMMFVRTALNMQLNGGADVGALCFDDKTSTSNKTGLLANTNLKITGKIQLSNTGITGFMRDGCERAWEPKSADSSEYEEKEVAAELAKIGQFTGKLTGVKSGNFDGEVELATGQSYGVGVTDAATTVGKGRIYNHFYNGLFARTGANASIENLTVSGSICSAAQRENVYTGGFTASAEGKLSLDSITASETVDIYRSATASNGNNNYSGGIIGVVANTETAYEISFDDCIISPSIIWRGKIVSNYSDSKHLAYHAMGGAIGRIQETGALTVSFSDSTLKANLDAKTNVSNTPEMISASGLIADITGSTTDRTIELDGLIVAGTVIQSSATSYSGGILGSRWYNTNVNITERTTGSTPTGGVLLQKTGNDNNSISTAAANYAGLIYYASGRWQVEKNGLTINNLNASSTGTTSFGIIANQGKALFLELKNKDSYDPGTSCGIPTNTTVYDDFVAYNMDGGVISITTDGNQSMASSTGCNTWQNHYNYAKTNSNTRYYYNLTSIGFNSDGAAKTKAQLTSDEAKLMMWSLNKYAATGLKKYFTNSYSATGKNDKISGTFDLLGYSYYPVDAGDIDLGDITVKFYNQGIEDAEASTGNTDTVASPAYDGKRSTRTATQHYLMHSGLFTKASSITVTGDLRFKGNIGSDSTHHGVLVNDTLSGSFDNSGKKIILDGITMSDTSGALLINKISGSNMSIKVNGVRAGGKGFNGETLPTGTNAEVGYSGVTLPIAYSLIGDVTGSAISMEFKKIKLDARSESSTDTTLYGTSQSLFSRATLLNSYKVDTPTAIYNYSSGEDWSGSTHIGDVTYGSEIDSSVEFVDKQHKYYGESQHTYATDSDKTNEGGTDFTSGYRPYVYTAYNATNGTHEIKVNHYIAALNVGCGTYNHPYVITDGALLANVAAFINDQTNFIPKVRLPITVAKTSNNYNNHWCTTPGTTCAEYTCAAAGANYTGGTNAWTATQVREYLASAYYLIRDNSTEHSGITISDNNFVGLGSFDSNGTGVYSFRGVIKGEQYTVQENGTNVQKNLKIINSTDKPLIRFSSGAVVKDVDIEVTGGFEFNQTQRTDKKAPAPFGFSNDDTKAYGGVIGKILAGDNIIDNVSVAYDNSIILKSTSTSDSTSKKVYQATSVVGGYVGVITDGCLMFRNMENTSAKANSAGVSVPTFHVNSLSPYAYTDVQKGTDGGERFLYVNPIIGRVINGFAVYETDTYRYSEDGKYANGDTRNTGSNGTVSLKNGRKNYSIADIKMNSSTKLDFNSNGTEIYAADAQSLFILAGILQTGAGAANGSFTADYDYTTAYKDRYSAVHHADYTYIGDTTNATTEKTDIIADTVNVKTCVPYIVYHYTSTNSSNQYPARYMAHGVARSLYLCSLSEKTTTLSSDIYYMPDGFRGIGSMSIDNPTTKGLKLDCFNGKNQQVDIDISVNYYSNTTDNYYTGGSYSFGTALFCELEQNGTFNNANSNDTKTIGNVKLSGYSSSNRYEAKDFSFAAAGKTHRVYNGGLIGFSNSNLNIRNVTFSDLRLESGYYNGGLLGHPATKGKIFVNNCTSDSTNDKYLKITGGLKNGGYLSDMDDGSLFVNTLNANSSCTLKIEIEGREISDESYSGGIIGKLWGGTLYVRNVTLEPITSGSSYIGVSDSFTATNTSVAKYNDEAKIPNAGGIIGILTKGTVIVTDCKINNMIIRGFSAGGIIGYNHMKRDAYYNKQNETQSVKLYNCEVNGCTIKGNYAAGGLVGIDDSTYSLHTNDTKYQDAIDSSKYYINDIDKCVVKNSTIEHKNSGGSTGGLVGRYNIISINKNNEQSGAKSDDKVRYIYNSNVENCNLVSPSGSSTGGLVGVADDTILYGCNLAINLSNSNCSFKKPSNDALDVTYKQKAGNLIGSAKATSVTNYEDKTYVTDIRLIGVTRQGAYLIDKTTGTNLNDPDISERDSSNVTVSAIYADYDGASLSMTDSTAVRSTLTDVAAASDLATDRTMPYVIVSPKKQMGSTAYLTGDGASTYIDGSTVKPLAEKIVGDTSSIKKYQNVSSTDLARINAALVATNDNVNRIQTYKGSMLTLPGSGTVSDFPVVVINSITKADSTALIQSYIRLMTNTSSEYAFSVDKEHNSIKYDVDRIFACSFSNGNYSVNNSATAGLGYDSYQGQGRFYMNVGSADSNQPDSQFSLIDVVFYDPSDSTNTKVAYHLYVPVLTKKMVTLNFQSASLGGTDMKPSSYATPGNTILENSGSWITAYVSYTYAKEELESLLNGGIALDWNHEKQLIINKVTGGFPDSTKVVLLDPNGDKDKVYYATYGGNNGIKTGTSSGGDVLELKQFSRTDSVVNDGEIRDVTSNFVPSNLEDLITISATTEGSNKHYTDLGTTEPASSNDVVIKASDGHYYKFNEGDGTHALIVSGDLVESYYLSFMIPNDGTLHHVDVRTPGSLPADKADCPLGRVSDLVDAKLTKIIVGDLYQQDNVSIAVYNDNDATVVQQTVSAGQELLDDDHSIIHVGLSTQVSLKSAVQTTIAYNAAANDQLRLYQAFIIYMDKTKLDTNGSARTTTKLISGNAPVTASYSTDNSNWSDADNLTASGAYIKLRATDITDALKAENGSGTATLYAKVALNYTNDTNKNAEFPERTAQTGQNDIGVNVNAKSNLASGSQDLRLVYSKISATINTDNHHFYIKKKATTHLKYAARKDKLDIFDKDGAVSFNYSQLGLNGKNLAIPNQHYIPIYSTATYDASDFEQINSADTLRYEFTLYRKTDVNGEVKYVQIENNLGNYLKDGFLKLQITNGLTGTTNTAQYSLSSVNGVFTKDYTLGANDKEGDYAADVLFDVLTGGDFHEYANYRMKLKVSLRGNSNSTELAYDESWIVYTNAKIDPSMHN